MNKIVAWSVVLILTGPLGVIALLVWLAMRGLGVKPWRS